MKILCTWCDQLAIGDTFERVNIFPALEHYGHEVKVFPLLNPILNAENMRPLDYELLETIDTYKPDLMIFLLYHNIISKETVKYITENTKTTTLMICGDDEKQYKLTSSYAPYVNNIVTTFLPAKKWHERDAKVNVIYSCYSANPKIYKRLNIKKSTDVSFYGGANEYRVAVLNGIILKDIRIRVYGNGWRDDSIITTAQCVNLINETKVNLNISVDYIDNKEILQIKARDFEVPMCGGFLLTHSNPLLSEFYEIGKEIETYKNINELTDKIKRYTKDNAAREKIANAGYRRAKRYHKTTDRWEDIFKQCYFKNGGTNGAV
jgi:spore maturation protein CgeB